ncbi:glycosyltransferase family 2 protein [Flavobacterium sp. XS2P39]|uniref:glycosyltransferase family 2 protein n=1 Tax=Flavobacterium sp. XS2P39 TaxID=3401725 RepID=UPI003AADD3F0
MENDILISIIITCYNDAKYVEQSVLSALNQTYRNKEVIIVDDGSNAATKAVLKKLEPKITKLITQENKGQSKARNVGIEASNGNYILILDSDDYFESTFCEKAILVLENETIKLVTSYTKRFNYSCSQSYYPKGGEVRDFLMYNQATGSAMFRKADCIIVEGYDETMRFGFEDWEFYIRLLKNGGKAFIIPEFLFYYRLKENSTTSRANKIKYQLQYFIYEKHKDLYILYFQDFISHLLHRIEREEIEKNKNMERLEFKIGKAVLKPLRYIISVLK